VEVVVAVVAMGLAAVTPSSPDTSSLAYLAFLGTSLGILVASAHASLP
jgi:hydrogenase/urease accessory protein HupE